MPREPSKSKSKSKSKPPRRTSRPRRSRRRGQLELDLRTWGGKRRGAGRKPTGTRPGVSHRRREPVANSHPVHVTMRVRRHVWNLRARRCRRVLEVAFTAARERHGMRLVHYSIQGNHVHLLVEARGREALARGVQGLSVRIARGLNRLMAARGKVLADRYHAHVLRTPREVRRALRYVLRNADRHGIQWRTGPNGPRVDPCSSGRWFDGWQGGYPAAGGDGMRDRGADPSGVPPVSPPGTWLLRVGWRRHGLVPLA